MLARLAECCFQAQRLHRQLAAAPYLLAAVPPPEPIKAGLRRRWLARLLEEATDGLAVGPASKGAQALLRARHSAWLHEAAWLEEYLATQAP